jgi:hypothetical protein
MRKRRASKMLKDIRLLVKQVDKCVLSAVKIENSLKEIGR